VKVNGSRLEFLDATGLGALIRSPRRLRDQGTELRLTNLRRPVRPLPALRGFDRSDGLRDESGSGPAGARVLSSRSGTALAERRLAVDF